MPTNETILLVEDNQDDVFLVRAAFATARIQQSLHVVEDGREAIRYLGGEGKYADRAAYPFPFLLLLDLQLPIKDGFAVLEWLGAHPQFRDKLKVVVLTGTEPDASQAKARGLGVDAFLTKPLSFHQLEDMMRGLRERWIDSGNLSGPRG